MEKVNCQGEWFVEGEVDGCTKWQVEFKVYIYCYRTSSTRNSQSLFDNNQAPADLSSPPLDTIHGYDDAPLH